MKISCQINGSIYRLNLAKEAGLKHGRRLSGARLLSPHIIIDQNGSICSHSVDPSLTHFYVSFQAWDWLWNPMLWSQRRNSGAHGAENSIQISALTGVESRTLESSGRQHYH